MVVARRLMVALAAAAALTAAGINLPATSEARAAPAAPVMRGPISNPACARIRSIAAQLETIRTQKSVIAVGNRTRWCPLNRQQIVLNDEMIRIFDGDFDHCGARDPAINRLRRANEKLRVATAGACGP